jgi:hypothetical protein
MGHMLLQFISIFKICKSTCSPLKFVAIFSICQWICAESIVICMCSWSLTSTYPPKTDMQCISIVQHLVKVWELDVTHFECANKFGGPIYFPSNLEYSNELQKHMHCGYSSPCLPWLKKTRGFPWKSESLLWFAQCACSSSPVQTPVRWKYEKQNQWVLSDQITHHFIMTSFQWEMLNCTICMDILLQKNINLWHFQPNMSKTLYWEKL